MERILKTKEIQEGLLETSNLKNFVESVNGSYIYHPKHPIALGNECLLKVNVNIGISNPSELDDELRKLNELLSLTYAPDTLMSHGDERILTTKQFWRHMVEKSDLPVGTIPVYSLFNEGKGIDKNEMLETVEAMASGGVSFMGLHLTATRELYELAKRTRKIKVTSWGGRLVLDDCILNSRETNIIDECIDDIFAIYKKYRVTLNIGTTFRPARIDEALDEVHVTEIKMQQMYIKKARQSGINVVLENSGHIPLWKMDEFCTLVNECHVPLQILGMLSDSTIGFDHLTGALASFELARKCNVGTINSITRAEHTGGVPTTEDVIEGLKCARTVAHIINAVRFPKHRDIDKAVSDNRTELHSCCVVGGLLDYNSDIPMGEGCSRCTKRNCPLRK